MTLSRLVSRKLTVTIGTVVGLIAAKAYVEAAGVAVAYITAQGVIDHAEAKKAAHVLGTLDEVIDAVRAELSAVPQVSAGVAPIDYTTFVQEPGIIIPYPPMPSIDDWAPGAAR